jgi:hypothetical protein
MRIMSKHDERKIITDGTRVALKWPRACFEAEVSAEAQERPHLPTPRGKLEAGDRVSFDLGEGVDGPLYATNVRLIDPD